MSVRELGLGIGVRISDLGKGFPVFLATMAAGKYLDVSVSGP